MLSMAYVMAAVWSSACVNFMHCVLLLHVGGHAATTES